MVKEVIIYIEGDTKKKGNSGAITFRQGLREFFGGLAKEIKIPVDFKVGGARETTIKIFLSENGDYPQSFQVLLVDSEGEIDEKDTPKKHLQKISAKFDFKNVKDGQCHLMAQMMEAWFLADKEKLAEFYGKGFNVNALPKHTNVEKIPKANVRTGLINAVRDTSKKYYEKGEHAGEILRKIDSDKVRKSAPHCERLFKVIKEEIEK